jgi:hypothetical protein
MTLLMKASGVDLSGSAGDVFTTSGRPFVQAWAPLTITAGGGSGPLPAGIAFPSFDKSYGYGYVSGTSSSPIGPIPYDDCTTFGRLPPQEWGPAALGYSAPHVLDDIDLGAAPLDANGAVAADLLEMSVNLTQSTVPDFGSAYMLFTPWPCEISQGDWMDCEDGCCPVEAMVGIARQFWVEIVGERIVLRRQQSVSGVLCIPAGSSGLADQFGVLTHHIDDRQGGGSGASNSTRLGGPNQCTVTNSVDYSTAYTGQLLITPVNYRGND